MKKIININSLLEDIYHVYTVPDRCCIVTDFVPDRPPVYTGNDLTQYDFYIG